MTIYSWIMLASLTLLGFDCISYFFTSGEFSDAQLAFETLNRCVFAYLRPTIFIMILQISCLLQLQLKTQVLDNGRICILGIDKFDQEQFRLKMVMANSLDEANDMDFLINKNSVLQQR